MASFVFIIIVVGVFAVALGIWHVIRRSQVGSKDVEMLKLNTNLSARLRVITVILGVVLAFFFLLFGVANLISPDVPDSYLDQNTRMCVMLIIVGVVSIYALFCPYSGGILLCICAVSLGVLIHSIAVLIFAVPILLLGMLSIMRGRLSRQLVSEEPDQPS